MSEPETGMADAALQARIASLREMAARVDPVRWQYVEALAARVAVQPDAVRQLLWERLAAAVAACEERCARQPAIVPRKKGGAVARTPLAELNRSIRAAAPNASQELTSAQRFRRAWLGTRAQEQVREAVGRRPANAGPLNSHALVLESLAVMARLSPDYLRRFVVHVQALQWLDQARADDAPPAKNGPRPKKASPRAARRQ